MGNTSYFYNDVNLMFIASISKRRLQLYKFLFTVLFIFLILATMRTDLHIFKILAVLMVMIWR